MQASLVRELLLYATPKLVSHAPEGGEAHFFRTSGLRRIGYRPVQPRRGPRKERACLVGVVANGDHVVERLTQVSVKGLGLLSRYVYANLLHSPYG